MILTQALWVDNRCMGVSFNLILWIKDIPIHTKGIKAIVYRKSCIFILWSVLSFIAFEHARIHSVEHDPNDWGKLQPEMRSFGEDSPNPTHHASEGEQWGCYNLPRMMHQITKMIPCIAGVACKNLRSECLGFMNANIPWWWPTAKWRWI